MQTAAGEAESSVGQDVSADDQVAVVLLARHHTRLSQHVRPRLGALPSAGLARHLPRHVVAAWARQLYKNISMLLLFPVKTVSLVPA